jgi:signal transduction histidine kinase
MPLDTQTTIFMICFVYLILHGAIWLALQEYRSLQVKLWCASGMFSGMAVVLLAMRGYVPDIFFYLLPEPQTQVYRVYNIVNICYFILFVYLIAFIKADWEALIVFNAFYALLCFDYFRIGLKLQRKQDSLGARLLMWAGLILTSTLAVRAIGVWTAGSIQDIYAPSWHQAQMVIGQFMAITLSNIAFLRIFLEIAERKKSEVALELSLTTERADTIQRNSLSLKQLLEEREEIIRQLSLFNKTAGMGALVASLAHELNQPLTVIQLNTDMIELVLNDHESKLNHDKNIDTAMAGLRNANQRAATIISTLRNMFGNGRKSISEFYLNELVNDVVLLCQSTLQKQSIHLEVDLSSHPLTITGDKSQLQQVLLNLITNAGEAFSQDFKVIKKIKIQTKLKTNQIRLTVIDNGCGISPEIQAVVFDLLRTNKDSGMGIGLWLSKTIVESHNGTINFETEINKGSTFTVDLPLTTTKMYF